MDFILSDGLKNRRGIFFRIDKGIGEIHIFVHVVVACANQRKVVFFGIFFCFVVEVIEVFAMEPGKFDRIK